MKFLINLPHLGEREPELTTPSALVAIAQATERAGLDAVGLSDHPFPLLAAGTPAHQSWDPFSMLGYLAAATSRIRLVTLAIILPYRNPFLIANAARTVDHISGGRLTLGVGTGYLRGEFDALGASFDRRNEIAAAAVDAIKAAWTGEPVTAVGDGWTAAGNVLRPPPLSQPHPPVWMGGNSVKAIERAAASCEGWAPVLKGLESAAQTGSPSIASTDDLRKRIAKLRELEEDHDRRTPLEICLLRSAVGWASPDPTPAVLEEIEELEEAGVTWVAFHPEGRSLDEVLDRVAAWGSAVGGR